MTDSNDFKMGIFWQVLSYTVVQLIVQSVRAELAPLSHLELLLAKHNCLNYHSLALFNCFFSTARNYHAMYYRDTYSNATMHIAK